MEKKRVKDLMLPLSEYAVVSDDATLLDALKTLESAQEKLPPGKQPHRAVLVVNDKDEVVGKIGQLAFLKGLEPKYADLGDISMLSRAGISDKFIDDMLEYMRLWSAGFNTMCTQAKTILVKDVMRPVKESIDEKASLSDAVHKIIIWQTLSLLVTREGKVVGILRLADLFTEIADYIKYCAEKPPQ